MLLRTISIIFGVATVAVLNALVSQPRNGENIEAQLTAPAEASQPAQTSTSQQVMLSGFEPDESVPEFVNQMPFLEDPERAAMTKAWNKLPNHDVYRAARLPGARNVIHDYGEIAGAYGLALFVINATRADNQRHGLVVILRRSANRYDAYWIFQDQDLSNFSMSRSSGSVFVWYPREGGARTTCRLQWVQVKGKWTCE